MAATDKKLFLGGRLRRIRRDLGATQGRMAENLGVSASYFNLLERNQRPVTAQMLLRLAEAYDLDLRSLTRDEGAGAGLDEVFSDQMFKDLKIGRHEVAEVAESSPAIAEAISRLYRAHLDRGRMMDLRSVERPEDGMTSGLGPNDWVRDFIHGHKNHFPELEDCGASLARTLPAEPQEFAAAARQRLKEKFNVDVRTAPVEVLPNALRWYDHHRRRLMLSEVLSTPSRSFALAYQLVLLEFGAAIDELVDRAEPPELAIRNLLKVAFANYAAAAVLMPYEAMFAAVEETNYDIARIRLRFGVSHEQVCHRLTTLARPGARGVPFFMLGVDSAGNISKRFASAAFPFSRFGGTCPRWNIHDTFRMPGHIITQVIETPDGARYFTLSRTVRRVTSQAGDHSEIAIGLGCDLKYASKLIYSRGLNMADPAVMGVGPSCRICERPACPQRAAAPLNRTLAVHDYVKSISPYPFEA